MALGGIGRFDGEKDEQRRSAQAQTRAAQNHHEIVFGLGHSQTRCYAVMEMAGNPLGLAG
jgi:hypothetical protein